ncbi:MAG: FHA domain-containing protein [Bdellovibrionota bacterium]
MKLLIRKDGKFFSEVPVHQKVVIAGRSKNVDVVLGHHDVSRQHIKLSFEGDEIFLEDLKSKNGTIFKKKFLKKKTTISIGEVFHVGPFSLSVEEDENSYEKTMMMEDLDSSMVSQPNVASEDDTHYSGSQIKLPAHFLEDMGEDPLTDEDQENSHNPQTDSSSHEKNFSDAIAIRPKDADEDDETSRPITKPILEDLSEPLDEHESSEIQESANPKSLLDSFLQETDDDSKQDPFPLQHATEASVVSGSVDSQPNIFTDIPETAPSIQDPITRKEPRLDAMEQTAAFEDDVPSAPVDPEGKTFIAPASEPSQIKDPFRSGRLSPDIQMMESSIVEPQHRGGNQSLMRKLVFIGSSLLVGLMILYFLEGDKLSQVFEQTSPSTTNQGKNYRKLSKEEDRILRFQLDGLSQELESLNMDKAKQRLDLLKKNFADHPEVVELEKKWIALQSEIERREEEEERIRQEKMQNIQNLMRQAQIKIDQKQFDRALDLYEEATKISPNDVEILQAIEDTKSLKEQHARIELSQERQRENLTRIYKEGARKYDAGQFGEAQKLLNQVAQDSSHPDYASAKKMLKEIAQLTDTKLQQQISEASEKMRSAETLPKAYQELSELHRQFPASKEINDLLKETKEKMEARAKELYAEGLAQEELAADPASALDLYQEVLKYAPDSSDRYHQKAQEKIRKLQI